MLVDAFVDAAKVSGLVTGLTSRAEDEEASLLTTFPSAFESNFEDPFAFAFSGAAAGAGDLKARSSCVDMEFSSLLSRTAGVDTKDLVAADVLASCELVVGGGFSTVRGMD
jgi:hypothetical protein